tara:strand:- start:3115 stop:5406 length:2292 start_codon:yes stop_codon:yes gene_type:complete
MIITQEKSKRVVSSHDFDSVNCTIDAEDMRYVASLLRNNYSNPPLAVVREISANALDANKEANATRKVEITLPSKFQPNFCVRDFGSGLSKEDVFGLYSKYGKSTKRNSNSYIGAFGIGKFAPLSYGNNFTCVSYHGGTKSSYNIFVNEDDDTKIVEMHQEPSNEPSGLSVEVAIADEDVDKFREIVKAFFRFFSEDEMPKFIGIGDDEQFFDKYDVVLQSKDDSWFIIDDKQDYWRRSHSQSHAFMGRVHYPINTNSIDFKNYVEEDYDYAPLKNLCDEDNVYLRFDIGELKLHHSRESLEYNKATQKAIVEHLRKMYDDIQEIAKEKLGGATCLWDAKAKYAQVINALPYQLRSIFQNSFKWKGIPILGATFHRSYHYNENIIITEYTKSEDKDVTDGYKVKSQKSSRIDVHKNNRLVLQDIKSSHGNALRARTIFNTDDSIVAVYVVSYDKSGETYMFNDEDGWQLNLVSDENISYTSNIEKAKLKQGTRSSGESRSSVPTFLYDPQGYRNSDQWKNGAERDDLEEELDDDSQLVYISISNYKPSGESATDFYSLDSLKRDYKGMKALLKNLDEPMIDLHGIRKADVSKLDKSKWIEWQDYRIRKAKGALLRRKADILRGERRLAYTEHRHEMSHVKSIEGLLANKSLKNILNNSLDKNHDVREAMNILADSQLEDVVVSTLSQLKKLVHDNDKDWFDKNFSSTYKWKSFDYLCKDISDKYPLLVNINSQVYGWANLSESNFGKNIADYISMCDKLGEEA